ncbi:hypothetical protein DSCW_18320 [Desulfosarcina widdelii]|uniref:Holin of 3TMs, for gene-transfer release n=1 Tax=Desulfosarcina widdelii TaxID=947919 RepID=A0A5K7Z139_9BACT|nr:3TM-type holin [Desulfosarcina widdelii]BBO74415.1 hypothetical protein DSCW_18320 [Desulfosarcina widdelii]
MSNVLEKIIDGVKVVAPMAANLFLPGSGTILEGLMRAVTGDGPEVAIEAVAEKIAADPALMVELQVKAMEHEARLEEIEAKKLASVNQTMQAESKSEKWPQYTWRPFNGFTFPLAVLLIYFALPALGKAVPDVPQWVWVGWLSILGVATWDRGKEKRAKSGDTQTGLIEGAIKAIRG